MNALGRIIGAVGLLLLLSAPVTLILTTANPWYAGGKAVAGAALLVIYGALNFRRLAERARAPKAAQSKATFFVVSSAVMALVTLIGLGAINYIVAHRNQRWDLTKNRIYSLRPQSLDLLKALPEPVQGLAFVDEDRQLQELLERYAAASPKFTFRFLAPDRNPDLARKYSVRRPTLILTRGEGDLATHAAVSEPSEQEITNALMKLVRVGEQKVYFLIGHGELSTEDPAPSPEPPPSISGFRRDLSREGYVPALLDLAQAKNTVPADAALLVVAGPKDRYTEAEEAALRQYLAQGGRLIVFADPFVQTGLDKLIGELGLQLDEGLVADPELSASRPYAVVGPARAMAKHEITQPLKQTTMNTVFLQVRALSVLHEGLVPEAKPLPIVLTSPYAFVVAQATDRPEAAPGQKMGSLPLVAVSTRLIDPGASRRFDEARLVVFGDSDLLTNAVWDPPWTVEANRNLVMNAVAWSTAQVARITLRPPERDMSSIDLDEGRLARIRFLAMDVLPLFLLCLGLGVWLARRSK